MGKRIKRVKNGSAVLLLILFMVFGSNINSMHVRAETWGDYKYEVIDEQVNIEAYIGNDTVLVIPSTIAGKEVGQIGWGVFRNCSELSDVTIPSSVTYIDDGAFYGCRGLMSISVAANNANYCSESGVLFNKNKRELLCCPEGKKGTYTIPSSVTDIRWGAFADCSSLTNVTIPSSVVYIGSNAFNNCSSLMSISVVANNTDYCSEAGVLFNKAKSELLCCPAGKKGTYTIPSSVTDIGSSAFSGCSGLTDVAIPSSVTNVGWGAFVGCSGLTNVTIPSSVTEIDIRAFNCSGLTEFRVAENNKNYCSEAGVLFNKDKSMLVCYPAGRKGRYTIPSSVTSIYVGAFYNCTGLTGLTIPRSVKEIVQGGSSDSGFEGCYNITLLVERDSYAERFAKSHNLSYNYIEEMIELDYQYVVLKDGTIKIIGYEGKNSILEIPDTIDNRKVTGIGAYTFSDCNGLTSVKIPNGVTSIGEDAFDGCNHVTLIVGKDSYAEQYAKDNKIPYKYIGENDAGNTTTEDPKEPTPEQSKPEQDNKTTEVPKEPTTEQSKPEQPVPNQPAKEEEKVIVGSVTMVPVETETNEKSVTDNKVKTQRSSKKVKKGTVLVGKTGIYKVTNVKKKTVMYMKPKNKKTSYVKVPEQIKIKNKKYKVTSVSANAFKNNKKIKTVTIGQNVKEIGKNAFRGCKNLKKVTIGKNVTTIGSYAFYNCKKLNSIEIRSSKIKKVGKAAFKKIAKHPTARVPKGKIDSYKKLFKGKM